KLDDKKVKCHLCSHKCLITAEGRGICGVRKNNNGTLYSLVYGKAIAATPDPIEKKPLFHFLPGTMSFSIATVGCNFRCEFCQNWSISQEPKGYEEIVGDELLPNRVIELAEKNNCRSISYTYTEPTIFFEYAYDTSIIAKGKNLYNVFVTNGFMTDETLDKIDRNLDAANVDLKSFSDSFYRKICGARLDPILNSLRKMKRMGMWVEITTLLIPEKNDSEEELEQIAEFIRSELGEETPWHISRFHPDYKMKNLPSTDTEKIHRAREIGIDTGLRYVYAGNIPGDYGENTYCYNCGELLIRRFLFSIHENKIENSRCIKCGAKIDGVGL
ncbi:MAG TPA: AmmeMemoRadiSam system radical SAM enzyme, partial [Candidatus Altiarchaeales archaeon]|nr:AmmeMemoRadiSam system radical SAM enzyme [Candidatus Altiarchaeales archaeon]